ncbi:unnamed protein product [Hanseniaspora opuntiae]
MCSHLRESNCHYKVKKPKFTRKSNEFVFATKSKMYEIMKELCFTSLECASQCTDAKIIDDPNGFNINGMKPALSTASPAIEKVTDDYLMATIFVNQTMIYREKNLILKDGSVFHPIVDKRKHNRTNFESETCLALEGQIQGRQQCYLCLLCFDVSKSFKSLKPECPRNHIVKVHRRTANPEGISLDAISTAVIAFVIENGSSLSFAVDDCSTQYLLELANIDPALLTKSRVTDVIVSLDKRCRDLLNDVVSDTHYKIPTLNSACSDFYERILEETSKCHTFYSLTQDGLTVKKTTFESIVLHLNRYYEINYDKLDIESDHSSHLLSVKAVKGTRSQRLYEQTLGVIDERIGNINSLGGITTNGAPNVAGMRELFAKNHKVFSLKCNAHLIQMFYSSLFKLFVDTTHTLKLHAFDQFYVVMSQVDVSIEECRTLSEERLKIILNDPSQIDTSIRKENCGPDLTAFDRCVEEEDTDDDEHDEVDSSEDFSDTMATETNDSVDNSRDGFIHENDEFSPLEFLPDIIIDFENVAHIAGLEDVIDDDPYFINILERATNISTLETIIQKLDDCSFDPQHEDFAAALKYLKSVNFGIAHIQQMNRKLRAYHALLDQKSQIFLGFSSTPKMYNESRWISLKAFYEPYISPICRPIKFKEHNRDPRIGRKLPLSFWLTYEDLIFMRVMMGYLNELGYLTDAVSHKDSSVFSMSAVTEMAYEFSSTMLYHFFKMGILDEPFYSSTLKSNFNRFSSDGRGTIQDLCYLLNPQIAGSRDYLSETAILVHQILKYKFTDELFMDKDNYLTSKLNSSIPQLNNLPHNYKNVKALRNVERLKFGLQTNHRILEQFNTTGASERCAPHDSFIPKNTYKAAKMAYKYNAQDDSTYEDSVIFKSVDGNHTPEEKLLSLVAKDVAVYSRISKIVTLKNHKFLKDFQNKNERGNSKSYSRIYLHLRKMEINNHLALSTFLEHGYKSPLTWVMNLLMSIKPSSIVNETVFSHQNDERDVWDDDLDKELLESLVQLTLRSKASKNESLFNKLYKSLLTRKQRDLKYQTYGVISDSSDSEDDEMDVVNDNTNDDGVGNADSNPATKRSRNNMENYSHN